jgi:predicted ATP-dependent protease
VTTLSNDKSKQQIVAFVSDDEEENEKERKRILEVDHKKKIKEIQDQFEEMIRYMDTSFEKAFEKKEKDFFLAYRTHLMQIEEEIENLKNDGNDQKYVEIKKQKIKTLEGKLNKIRECALFLGDMSEMHKKTISKVYSLIVTEDLKQKVNENEQDKRFLEDQMQKARLVSNQVRSSLSQATQEYD